MVKSTKKDKAKHKTPLVEIYWWLVRHWWLIRRSLVDIGSSVKRSKKDKAKHKTVHGTGISGAKCPVSICPGCSRALPLLEIPLHAHACLHKRPALTRSLQQPTMNSVILSNLEQPTTKIVETITHRFLRCSSLKEIKLPVSAVWALQHVETSARRKHALSLEPLSARVKSLGYSEKDLDSALGFIRERAPLIIHIHVPRVLRLLLGDTHYRSLFETGSSSGTISTSSRSAWEDTMFGSAYL